MRQAQIQQLQMTTTLKLFSRSRFFFVLLSRFYIFQIVPTSPKEDKPSRHKSLNPFGKIIFKIVDFSNAKRQQ